MSLRREYVVIRSGSKVRFQRYLLAEDAALLATLAPMLAPSLRMERYARVPLPGGGHALRPVPGWGPSEPDRASALPDAAQALPESLEGSEP